MSLQSRPIQGRVPESPPASTTTSIKGSILANPRYPPGIESIVNRSALNSIHRANDADKENGREWLPQQAVEEPSPPASADSLPHGCRRQRSPSRRQKNPWQLGPRPPPEPVAGSSGSGSAASNLPPRERAVLIIQNACQSLSQTRDSMWTAIQEYFPRKNIVDFIELPAFKQLRKAVDHFIATLECLKESLVSGIYFKDENDISYMMYQIKDSLDAILGDSSHILKSWNCRAGGQEEGQPLTAQDRRLRRILIHDSNDQLDNLVKRVIAADARILQEHATRQPTLGRHMALPKKGWGWLRYLRTVCGSHGDVPCL